jgi:hypothetical protein
MTSEARDKAQPDGSLENPNSRSATVQKPIRINVNLTQDAYATLRTLAGEAGVDMSEFVRNALRVYTSLQREKRDGKHVYIGNRDKVEKELLLP